MPAGATRAIGGGRPSKPGTAKRATKEPTEVNAKGAAQRRNPRPSRDPRAGGLRHKPGAGSTMPRCGIVWLRFCRGMISSSTTFGNRAVSRFERPMALRYPPHDGFAFIGRWLFRDTTLFCLTEAAWLRPPRDSAVRVSLCTVPFPTVNSPRPIVGSPAATVSTE
jgi:hypothetical protein